MRVIVGALFIFSGGEKLMSAYGNFLYVVQGYEMFPSYLEKLIAHVVPWVEFFLGVFLVLGLWLRVTLKMRFYHCSGTGPDPAAAFRRLRLFWGSVSFSA
jgi:uncharacterized membrane protein YphA (DoxX/SURF4 family)